MVTASTWSVFLLVSLVTVHCKDDKNDRETANNLLGKLTTASVLDKKTPHLCQCHPSSSSTPAGLLRSVPPLDLTMTDTTVSVQTMNHFTGLLSLEGPSLKKDRRAEGFSIGDDICQFLKVNVKAPFVGKRSKKFPEGLNIGMFSNACGDKTWTNSENDYGDRICCRAGKYYACQ